MKTSKNNYTNTRVEFHILQSFPVTCLNRDDVGAPKTAIVGGTTRARVSSQCWKRQIRLALHDFGIPLANRTKLISTLIKQECMKLGATEEQAIKCGNKIAEVFGIDKKDNSEDTKKTDVLLFLGPTEINIISKKFKDVKFEANKFLTQKDQAKELSNVIDKAIFENTEKIDGVDIALFGRMIAQAPTLDIEAATSFSHAISTHKVSNEVEFFTAVDDISQAQGSAHMGSLEFNSATYYRYISLDLGQLYQTLGSDELFSEIITAFIKALYVAVPSARQNTQSGASTWDYAKVFVRTGQGVQLPIETEVKAKDGGFLKPSIEMVKSELEKKQKLSGSLFGKKAEFDFGEDTNFNIDNLIEEVIKAIKE